MPTRPPPPAQRVVKIRRDYNTWVANETLEDYALRFTPRSFRKWSELRVANTAFGAASFLVLEAVGATMLVNSGFINAFWAILATGLIIFLIGLPISHTAARHGLDMDLLTRGAGFGYIGSTVTSLIYACFTFILFAIEATIMADALQMCLGVPAYPIAHEKRHAGYILNTLLGGGMSSRLFQNIRERQGLAYSIYSDLNPYRDTGCLAVYAGTSLASASKVVQSVVKEFRSLKAEPVPEEELKRSKAQLKGSLMLSLESSTARMSNLARQEMYFDRFYDLDELIEKIEAVTAEDLTGLANEFFKTDSVAVTVLGNLPGLKITRDQLAC